MVNWIDTGDVLYGAMPSSNLFSVSEGVLRPVWLKPDTSASQIKADRIESGPRIGKDRSCKHVSVTGTLYSHSLGSCVLGKPAYPLGRSQFAIPTNIWNREISIGADYTRLFTVDAQTYAVCSSREGKLHNGSKVRQVSCTIYRFWTEKGVLKMYGGSGGPYFCTKAEYEEPYFKKYCSGYYVGKAYPESCVMPQGTLLDVMMSHINSHASSRPIELVSYPTKMVMGPYELGYNRAKEYVEGVIAGSWAIGNGEMNMATSADAIVLPDLCLQVMNSVSVSDANVIALVKEAPDTFSQIGAYQKLLSEKGKNFVKNLSSAELATRYGIALTVADIRSLMDGFQLVLDQWKKPQTRRKSRCVQWNKRYRGKEVTATGKVAYLIRYMPPYLDTLSSFYSMLMSLGLAPTATNLWDLVPYSFVANWIIDVESIFNSLDAFIQQQLLAITVEICSYQFEHTVSITPTQSVTLEYYQRDVRPRCRIEPWPGEVKIFSIVNHGQEVAELSANGMSRSLMAKV